MGILVGLAGVKGSLSCQRVVSVEHAVRRIQRRRAVTAAGSTGALNVWRDDRRTLRSEFMRCRVSLDRAEHADVAALQTWLEKWWPQLGRGDSDA